MDLLHVGFAAVQFSWQLQHAPRAKFLAVAERSTAAVCGVVRSAAKPAAGSQPSPSTQIWYCSIVTEP